MLLISLSSTSVYIDRVLLIDMGLTSCDAAGAPDRHHHEPVLSYLAYHSTSWPINNSLSHLTSFHKILLILLAFFILLYTTFQDGLSIGYYPFQARIAVSHYSLLMYK